MAFLPPAALQTQRTQRNNRFRSTVISPRTRTPTRAAPAVSMSYIRADLDHIAMTALFPVAQTNFYTNTLGFEPMRLEDFKAGKTMFPSVRISPATILDFFPSETRSANALHICFALAKPEFDALLSRLAAAGVETTEPKLLSGARGRGWAVYAKDPEGNGLEFRWYE